MSAQNLMLAYDEDFTTVSGGAGGPRPAGAPPAKDFTEQLREFTEHFPLLATPATATVLAFGAGGAEPPSLSLFVVPTQGRGGSSPAAGNRPDENWMEILGKSTCDCDGDDGDHDDDDERHGDERHDDGDHDDERHGGHGKGRIDEHHGGNYHLDETDNDSPYVSFSCDGGMSILDLAVDR